MHLNLFKLVINSNYKLIKLAFEIHQCIINEILESKISNELLNMNNKYVILLGDFIFSQSTNELSLLKSPEIVDIMSQSISNMSRNIVENYGQNLINLNEWKKHHINLIECCLPYCFYSLSYLLYKNLKKSFFTFGNNINLLIKLRHLKFQIEELKNLIDQKKPIVNKENNNYILSDKLRK